MLLPPEAQPLLDAFLPHFTQPTYARFLVLAAAAVLTAGRRTVANVLLAQIILQRLVPEGPIDLVGDDTVDGHPGPRVYGKGRHRDGVRSSHSYRAWRYGHKWVVLAVLVKFPFATRRWALPVLVDLYRTPEVSKAEKVRHRTPAQLMCRLLRLLLIRFPNRTFVFAGDSGFGSHEVARFCHRHRRRLALVSKCHPDVNPFEPPPRYAGIGRAPTGTDTCPRPTRFGASTRWSERIAVGGTSKRRFRNVVRASVWRRLAASRGARCCGRLRVCSACTRW